MTLRKLFEAQIAIIRIARPFRTPAVCTKIDVLNEKKKKKRKERKEDSPVTDTELQVSRDLLIQTQ